MIEPKIQPEQETIKIENLIATGKYVPISKYAGQVVISNLYSVYFGAWIAGFFGSIIFGKIIYEFITGKRLAPSSPDYFVIISAMVGIMTGVAQIILTETRARNERIDLYGPGKITLKTGLVVVLSAFSVYILINNALTFVFRYYLGPASVVKPESPYPFTTLDYLDAATNFSAAQSKQNILFIVLGYTVYFISVEFLLRGLIGGEFRKWRSGAGPAIIVPAFIQVLMFQIELSQLTKGTYYYYISLMALFQGLLAGVIFWITKKLWTPIVFTLMVHGLPQGEKFHTALLRLMPASMGTYDPIAPPYTMEDKLDKSIQTFLLILMFLAFLVPFVFSKQIASLISEVYQSTKFQWKGISAIIIAIAVINYVIYLMFSTATSITSLIVIFLLVGLVISLIANSILGLFLGKQPQEMILFYQMPEKIVEKIQIEPEKDINAFTNKPSVFEQPIKFSLMMSFVYLYGSFLAASYRNFYDVSITQGIILGLKIYVAPTAYIALISYLTAKAMYYRSQFDKQSFKSLNLIRFSFLAIITIFSIIWSSLGEFHVRVIGYLPAYLNIFPKDKEEKIKQRILSALNTIFRYNTIIYMTREKEEIIRNATDEWNNNQLPGTVTSALLAWKGMKKELETDTLKEYYEKNEKQEERLYGLALAIGLGKYKLHDLLFKLLRVKMRNVRYAAYWALGQIALKSNAPKLARAIEKEQDYELREMATKILLTIDPDYPLLRLNEEESEDILPDAFQEIVE